MERGAAAAQGRIGYLVIRSSPPSSQQQFRHPACRLKLNHISAPQRNPTERGSHGSTKREGSAGTCGERVNSATAPEGRNPC